ncbi:MAG: hypothetical protein AAFQ40_03345 [Cyanobacteria bacterium J06623_5]
MATSSPIASTIPSKQPAANPIASIEALLAPLQRLDQRLRQTIEVRETLSGTAFAHYLLGSIEPSQSPASAIAPHSPLAKLQAAFDLSDFEIEVVLLAIAPELDRRYERLYAHLQADNRRKPTLALSLDLLCHTAEQKAAQRNHLGPSAPLRRCGLIRTKISNEPITAQSAQPNPCDTTAPAKPSIDIEESQSFTLNPAISRYLLGQPMSPQLSTVCKLSWPTDTGYITNSPLLPSLLSRLKHGNMPASFTLNFTGTGAKAQGARAIAATLQKPLLAVDLSQIFKGTSPSKTEIEHIAQQILLQGRLWNTVMYLENGDLGTMPTAERRWIPATFAQGTSWQQNAAMKAFLAHIEAYSGITIFTGKAPYNPSANDNKGIITVPFTQPNDETATSYWQTCLEAAQLTLSETERFRQQLMGASLGFS